MKKPLREGIFALIGMLILIIDSKTALQGAAGAVEICLTSVIPSLFPFFVLSNILTGALTESNPKILQSIARFMNMPSGAEVLPICALLGGYPVGAQCIWNLYHTKTISKNDAERALAYCNNAGPSFIFGMISCLFQEKWVPWTLWGIHILSAVLVSRWFPCKKTSCNIKRTTNISLSDAVATSIKSIGQVCGWVVLFRIVIAFLSRWILWLFPTPIQVLLAGSLELTNGCIELAVIQSTKVRFIICSGILAFGGICVAMQTAAVAKGLNLKYYIIGKVCQTFLSLLFSYVIVFRHWLIFLIIIFGTFPVVIQKKSSIPESIGV